MMIWDKYLRITWLKYCTWSSQVWLPNKEHFTFDVDIVNTKKGTKPFKFIFFKFIFYQEQHCGGCVELKMGYINSVLQPREIIQAKTRISIPKEMHELQKPDHSVSFHKCWQRLYLPAWYFTCFHHSRTLHCCSSLWLPPRSRGIAMQPV